MRTAERRRVRFRVQLPPGPQKRPTLGDMEVRDQGFAKLRVPEDSSLGNFSHQQLHNDGEFVGLWAVSALENRQKKGRIALGLTVWLKPVVAVF